MSSGTTTTTSPECRLNEADRLRLIAEVYNATLAETESFHDEELGVDLAYLFGAIANDSAVDWYPDGGGKRPALLTIFKRQFPESHCVWYFIEL